MTIEELTEYCRQAGTKLTEEMQQQLLCYADLLKEWNERMNLTAITEREEVLEKHFLDCILPLRAVHHPGNICDVGSGAGFPGLVWQIVMPESHVTLLEPTGKRCTFLKEVIARLDLGNAEVANARAEDFAASHRQAFDVVTARAVANLNILSELCVPLVRKGGLFIAMKGSHGSEEAEAAEHAMKELGCVLSETMKEHLPSGERVNLVYLKTEDTPRKYPRNYGQMKKKPL